MVHHINNSFDKPDIVYHPHLVPKVSAQFFFTYIIVNIQLFFLLLYLKCFLQIPLTKTRCCKSRMHRFYAFIIYEIHHVLNLSHFSIKRNGLQHTCFFFINVIVNKTEPSMIAKGNMISSSSCLNLRAPIGLC